MAYRVKLVGAQAHEQTPEVAAYAVSSTGRISDKIGVITDGEFHLSRDTAVIALGPDVENVATLDPKGLVILRVADHLAQWEASGEILIPGPWWRGWLGWTICLSGSANVCTPIFRDFAALRAIGTGIPRAIFPESCEPLCNAVVEVWEYVTCCWPFPIYQVPGLIDNLGAFLAANPVMFPVPPQPDPGPVDAVLSRQIDAALGAGKLANNFVPDSTLSEQFTALKSLSVQDAATYIELHPMLWPFMHCTSSSAKLGETTVNPDGSFSYCYHIYPFFRWNCRTSYFYKVKQLVNGIWTYVYDGAAANQYFTAADSANLYTQIGQTCYQPPPLQGNNYIAFQAIGGTNTWSLNSNWNAAVAGIDKNQSGDYAMVPLIQDAGLLSPNGAPWATTLGLMLNYDAALQTASASNPNPPYYYRFTVVQADATGAPMAGAVPVSPLPASYSEQSLAWLYFNTSTNPVTISSQQLGPVTVGGNAGLYQIPYFGGSNPSWLGGQFHQYLDTSALQNVISGGPGIGNGQFLVVLEVFDESGNRLVPESAPAPSATPSDLLGPLPSADLQGAFNYVRLMDTTTTANVPWNSLTHVLWVDNRQTMARIEYFMSSAGVNVCQYYQGTSDTPFVVGFQAYHNVMCDAAPSPVPSRSFMSSFSLAWYEGLGGTSGLLATGPDTNWGTGCTLSVANAAPTWPPTEPSPPWGPSVFDVPLTTFGEMLGVDPTTKEPLTTCSFSINLNVAPKHQAGGGAIPTFGSQSIAAVALGD